MDNLTSWRPAERSRWHRLSHLIQRRQICGTSYQYVLYYRRADSNLDRWSDGFELDVQFRCGRQHCPCVCSSLRTCPQACYMLAGSRQHPAAPTSPALAGSGVPALLRAAGHCACLPAARLPPPAARRAKRATLCVCCLIMPPKYTTSTYV